MMLGLSQRAGRHQQARTEISKDIRRWVHVANGVLDWVWDHSRSRHGSRLVLLSLADSTNQPGGWTWPSNAELKRRTGLGERAVQAAVIDLAKLGEVEVEYNGGPKGCNRYRVLMTPADIAGVQKVRGARTAGRRKPKASTTPQVKGSTPADSAPPAESAPPQISTPTPADIAHGTVREPIPSPTETAQQDGTQLLVAEWLEHCRKRPPERVVGHVSKELKILLDEGIDAGDVRHGLAQWHRSGRHPSTLASFVNEVMNGSSGLNGRGEPAKETTGMRKARQAREAATTLQAMVDEGRLQL